MSPAVDRIPKYADARDAAIARFERWYVRRLLWTTKGNVSEAARIAGCDRSTLHRLMNRHEIDREEFADRGDGS